MKRNRKKTFAYRPSDQIISRRALISVLLGGTGICGYYLLILKSIESEGNAGAVLGVVGWILLILSVAGLYLAVQSFDESASVMKWKIIGCASNAVVLAFSLILFIVGLIG